VDLEEMGEMTATNFDASLAFVLQQEGGWSDDARDPGGATQKGITFRIFQNWFPRTTTNDLRNICDDDVARIYRGDYWDVMGCDNLPSGIDLMVFDFGVNAGPARSVGYLQVVVGTHRDGDDGPLTQAAAARMATTDVITKLNGLQIAHYRALPTFDRFGNGWLARSSRRVAAALRMAGT
jgi:lysozyme family protein